MCVYVNMYVHMCMLRAYVFVCECVCVKECMCVAMLICVCRERMCVKMCECICLCIIYLSACVCVLKCVHEYKELFRELVQVFVEAEKFHACCFQAGDPAQLCRIVAWHLSPGPQ